MNQHLVICLTMPKGTNLNGDTYTLATREVFTSALAAVTYQGTVASTLCPMVVSIPANTPIKHDIRARSNSWPS